MEKGGINMSWDSVGGLQDSNSFSIGRSSPVLVLGVGILIVPWVADVFMSVPGWVKSFASVVGIIFILVGAVLSAIDR